MKNMYRQALGLIIIIPFVLSITGWFLGWELTYRPIANAPIISPFTSIVFIILLLNKINFNTPLLSSFSRKYIKTLSLGSIASILFLELAIHTGGQSEFLGIPLSSISTILTFFTISVYEITTFESKESDLYTDALLLLSLFWAYLSICGHLFGEYSLTGISDNEMIGLSLPTAIAFLLYVAILFKEDQTSFLKKLFKSVSWTRRYILTYFSAFLILPLLFVGLLKNVAIQDADHFKVFILFSLIGLFFIVLFIVLILFLSRTHTGLQMICSYTKRIKVSDGSWMPIEAYLTNNYGLELKKEVSPDAIKSLSKQIKNEKKS